MRQYSSDETIPSPRKLTVQPNTNDIESNDMTPAELWRHSSDNRRQFLVFNHQTKGTEPRHTESKDLPLQCCTPTPPLADGAELPHGLSFHATLRSKLMFAAPSDSPITVVTTCAVIMDVGCYVLWALGSLHQPDFQL